MAKVSLRSYNREIGTLIDQGQLEEAVGHCNHILKTFPKHLETYQLLGKAYLEAKRYKDASDVFSRLLAAVPNDFVAHVGMSMIGDETQSLDDAIWHMERAFEAQPSNAAVQSELQRLYGRRDGVQPPKIRMTSGALANVYMQGELYPQAIAEIMSVEVKEPGRMDMQVLLALAYYRSGQRVEASKVASDILSKSPYNLDANRILVTILPETSRAESTQVYRHRVNALDPYATFAKNSIFDTSDVPDPAVSIEKLDWQPGDTVFKSTGDFRDPGIQANGSGNDQPDWLKNVAPNADFGSDTAAEPPAELADDIPEFMRAAGWGTSSGATEEPLSFFDSQDSDSADDDTPAIAQAELPEWMKNIAPEQSELDAANDEPDDMGDDDMADDFINDLLGNNDDKKSQGADDLGDFGDLGSLGTSSEEQDAAMNWLESLAANQGANPEELITDPSARTENAPEWVQKAANAGNPPPATPEEETENDDMAWLNETEDDDSPAAEPAGSMPDWLNEIEDEDDSTAVEPAGSMPDWLNEIEDEDDSPAAEPAGNMPDWLNELDETNEPTLAPSNSGVTDLLNDLDSKDTPESDTDDSPDWLNNFGLDDDESDSPNDEGIPSWLNEAAGEPPAPVKKEPANERPIGAISDNMIGTLGTSSEDQDAAMNWLESLAANQGANPEELITDPSARTEAAPEWVQKAQDASAAKPAEEPELPAAKDDFSWMNELADEEMPAPAADSADDIPEWLSESEEESEEETLSAPSAISDETIGTLGTSSEDQDAALNWLESLAANQGANPEELITDPNARTEAAPDWVQKAQDVSAAKPIEEPERPAAEDDLAWMSELADESTPAQSADSADDLPEWLSEIEEEVEEEPAEEKTQPTRIEKAPANAISDETIGTLGTSSEDQDAAMNWLESLAANQGANPEELITDPNARTEAAPEWVQKAQDVSAEKPVEEAPAAPEDDLAWMNDFTNEETPADSESEPLNWLAEAEEAPKPTQETETDDMPAWLSDDTSDADSEDVPSWLQDDEEPGVEELTVAGLASEAEEVQLQELAEEKLAQDAPEPMFATPEMAPEVDEFSAQIEEEPTAVEETPDWVKKMAAEEEPAAPVAETSASVEEELPGWLSSVNEEENQEDQSDDLPDWLKEESTETPVPPKAERTKAEEWKPIAAVAEEKPVSQPKEEKAAPPPRNLPPRRQVQRMNTTMLRDITLMSAQAAMREGNLNAALAEYGKLIKKKRLLAETIYDLREALYDYPVDVSIWQLLGDAYMRSGQLQEAINAYTKAEELLR